MHIASRLRSLWLAQRTILLYELAEAANNGGEGVPCFLNELPAEAALFDKNYFISIVSITVAFKI